MGLPPVHFDLTDVYDAAAEVAGRPRPQYVVREAERRAVFPSGSGRSTPYGPSLAEVLADCPRGYRLHSAVPIQRAGVTAFLRVIFERKD
jgi:hypothetical protein